MYQYPCECGCVPREEGSVEYHTLRSFLYRVLFPFFPQNFTLSSLWISRLGPAGGIIPDSHGLTFS